MKKIVLFIVVFALGFMGCYAVLSYPKLDLISGFSAKSMASAHFLDGRSQALVEQNDNNIPLVDLAENTLESNGASASVFGLKKRKAIYREGLGATLINADFDEKAGYNIPKRIQPNCPLPFPYGNLEPKDSLFANVDYKLLQQSVARAFDSKNQNEKKTRAVLVIYKDHIIAEKYSTGFDKNSRLLGWSMTKSITATYFGILQSQKKFDIYKPAPIAAWQNDDRKKITTNDLLHMNSGLEWEEDYGKISDVTKMLFLESDMTQTQVLKPAAFEPNTHWNYSSGTTNLLSGVLRSQFKTQQEYLDFWYAALIDKIGMYSMVVETDMKGNFVGSSYAWATARDWAKFGLLYLHQGNWNGETIFDKNWATYVATPTATSNQQYGAHFWLNAGEKFQGVAKNMYYCSGFQGQTVAIFPSQDLVVVRLGLTEYPKFQLDKLLKGVSESIK